MRKLPCVQRSRSVSLSRLFRFVPRSTAAIKKSSVRNLYRVSGRVFCVREFNAVELVNHSELQSLLRSGLVETGDILNAERHRLYVRQLSRFLPG
jgi:hypothetical protein